MADFPTVLTNAVDGPPGVGTEIVAKHLNNLEAKVGIDNSAVPTSLDYLLKNVASIEPGHKHSKLWATDGSAEAVSVDAAGSVGIGMTNPLTTLHLKGPNTVGNTYNTLTIEQGNIANKFFLTTAKEDGNFHLRQQYLGDVNDYVTVAYDTGKVGIGTTSPGKKLDVNGYIRGTGIFNTLNSAPADDDLAAGECACWFDKTNGAPAVMFKAKQADGTVKTGSISLS